MSKIANEPLQSLDEWEEDLKVRYPEPGVPAFQATDPEKTKEQFRDYAKNARPSVREFYRQNHLHQSYDFVAQKRKQYLGLNNRKMTVWEAMEYLNTLVDDSDPDTDLSQLEHLLQTSEQIRADGQPRWFILTGMIHDLGKILCLWNEPQWCVVGDTYPLGCAFSNKIVFPEFFDQNPDRYHPVYSTKLGVYEEGCGMDNVRMSWGHSDDNTNTLYITETKFSAYLSGNTKVYKCPSDRSQAANGPRTRSVSMNAMVGDTGILTNRFNPTYTQFKKSADIKNPVNIIVFLDEHPDTINDGFFVNNLDDYKWGNMPGSFHSGGLNFSFADGHMEFHRWQATNTVRPPIKGAVTSDAAANPPTDFEWLKQRTSVKY